MVCNIVDNNLILVDHRKLINVELCFKGEYGINFEYTVPLEFIRMIIFISALIFDRRVK